MDKNLGKDLGKDLGKKYLEEQGTFAGISAATKFIVDAIPYAAVIGFGTVVVMLAAYRLDPTMKLALPLMLAYNWTVTYICAKLLHK